MMFRAELFLAALTLALSAPPCADGAGDPRALHQAVARNELVKADDMLGANPRLINLPLRDGIVPLHVAAAANHRIMASLLLGHGADLRARTGGGFTPLHWAASRDAADTLDLLLDRGADPNDTAGAGVTPLHWAARRNATNTVARLIERGACLDRVDGAGLAPLDWAVKHSAHDTALLIAARLAARDLAAERTQRTPRRPMPKPALALDTPDDETPDPRADEPPETILPAEPPRVGPERTLVLPLGRDIEMTFVWIEPLGLWMSRYETTNEQFRRFDSEHRSLFREGFSLDGDRQPVVRVSWHRAKAFAQWLNNRFPNRLPAGFKARLPTEREWTVAARCGDHRLFPWGSEWPPRYGNYSDAAAQRNLSDWQGIENYDDGHPVSCPVEQSGANEWGLYGMGGNVWEWCEDWYDESRTRKVRKGGSWDYDPSHALLVDYRGMDLPDARSDTVGFRLVVASVP